MFNQPANGGGYFEAKDAIGHLVLITKVHEVYHNPTNVFGGKPQPRDEAKVDLVDLDAPGQDHRERVIVTHPGLVNRLSTGATNILGRVGQIPTDKGNPAFVLNGHEPQDIPRAQAWVEAFTAAQYAQPPVQGHQAAPQAAAAPQVAQYQGQPVPVPQEAAQAPQGYVQQQYAPQVPQQTYAQQPQPQYQPAATPEQVQTLMAQLGGQVIPQQQPPAAPPY